MYIGPRSEDHVKKKYQDINGTLKKKYSRWRRNGKCQEWCCRPLYYHVLPLWFYLHAYIPGPKQMVVSKKRKLSYWITRSCHFHVSTKIGWVASVKAWIQHVLSSAEDSEDSMTFYWYINIVAVLGSCFDSLIIGDPGTSRQYSARDHDQITEVTILLMFLGRLLWRRRKAWDPFPLSKKMPMPATKPHTFQRGTAVHGLAWSPTSKPVNQKGPQDMSY